MFLPLDYIVQKQAQNNTAIWFIERELLQYAFCLQLSEPGTFVERNIPQAGRPLIPLNYVKLANMLAWSLQRFNCGFIFAEQMEADFALFEFHKRELPGTALQVLPKICQLKLVNSMEWLGFPVSLKGTNKLASWSVSEQPKPILKREGKKKRDSNLRSQGITFPPHPTPGYWIHGLSLSDSKDMSECDLVLFTLTEI